MECEQRMQLMENPFTFEEVCKFIDEDLSQDYKDKYDIIDFQILLMLFMEEM